MAITRIRKSDTGRGWDVFRGDHRRPAGRGSTKKEALQLARRLTRNEGGGEIRIISRTGKIADSKTVSRPRRAAKRPATKVA